MRSGRMARLLVALLCVEVSGKYTAAASSSSSSSCSCCSFSSSYFLFFLFFFLLFFVFFFLFLFLLLFFLLLFFFLVVLPPLLFLVFILLLPPPLLVVVLLLLLLLLLLPLPPLVPALCCEVTESKFLARGPKWIFQLALLDSRSPVTPDHVRDLPAIAGAVRSDVDSDDSAEAVPTLLSGPGDPDRLLVSLSAFGQNLRLNATRDGGRGGLLAAQLAVEERWAAGASPTRSRMDRNQLCLYSGSVLDRPGSLVSLTACGGLTALVHVGGEVLFVRPLEKRELSSRLGAFSGLKHQVMRRRRRAERDADHASQRCGTARQDVTERKSSKVTEELRAKRAAIGVEDAYTVETLLVADSDMVRYHGADAAKRFLLTVMNMVYNMFQHQSLGVRINIRVTKLVLLHSRPETLKVGHHGERSLGSFCQWQHEEFGGPRYLGSNHVPGGRDEIPPVDSAVLVTRTDFCVHKEEPCDTVGMAYLGGVCSAKRKCVLAEDNGLNLAFTIAHELGHNVGMSHDDDHAACAGHAYIMSGEWVKGRNPSDLSWSSCSRDDLQKFLRSKSSACLAHTDPRTRDQLPLPPKLPGMHYSVDQQCQILFGSNATFCSDMKHLMCAGLWCLVEGDGSCKTKLDPPLDGTQCGPDKWCRASECVSKTPIPQHVDGDWSPWSPWSMCSRTCATGVRFRQRKCDHPPPGPGGHPCPNANVQHKACEGPPCPKGAPSFRDLQCLSYDRNGGKKKSDVLTAVVDDEKPCALFCSPVGRDISVLMADRVMDGTPCGPFEADLCVNGRCQTIGCDGVIGSSSKEDVCGVCNGDGRSCTVIRGDFNHTRGMGYVEAVVIPAGARRIRIVEDKPSHSFLALKDGGGGGDGKSINSDWKIELPGEFRVAGTTVRYVRRGLWEKMWARGPTSAPLRLLVLLFHDRSYSIHYEYTLSLNASQDKRRPESKETQQQQQQQQQHHHHNNNNGDHLYIWTHSGWNSCNVHCGGGERRTAVSCARLANKTAEVVDDSFCRADNRPPPRVAACDPRPCRFRWVSGEWGPCSATCGAGTQRRRVACVQRRHDGSPAAGGAWEEEEREGGRCQGPRPPPLRACEGRRCPGPGVGVWEASEWSQVGREKMCSEGCGTGVRTRNITCGGNCDPLTRPDRQEPCQDRSHCYEWKTGQWSKNVAQVWHKRHTSAHTRCRLRSRAFRRRRQQREIDVQMASLRLRVCADTMPTS
ncbi:A disintegrin and metalloproteinase with thrombospondin motifs 17 isoform X3 [Phyllopteryx taeniolatus]|uniref:A disintegrin and metalloproteinase with thrombospondin motifs 17 isoform X3 n=1 Tax=Phyllopteryx taeniolatus TaxID=161469 RepID=UPI002AD3830A|nr:A disintegrin and metalloproteinase with thrombospondin motifs 17 isoform X3 [Phyllopteryx taeniolatus]